MAGSTRRTVTQWLLLCVLFLGVVGMHHIATSGDMTSDQAMTQLTAQHKQSPEEPAPSPEHDMLHLCVAVLCVVVSLLLLLAWLLVRTTPQSTSRALGSPAWPRAPDHPPPIGGRALLSSVCVLRL
jgi:hypothetical protein